MLIGSAMGQVTMTQAQYGTGESGRAQWLLTNAGVADPAQELVLVHSTAATTAAPPASRPRCARGRIRRAGHRADSGPAASRGAPSRHDVLVQFAMKGNADTADTRVQPVLAAWRGHGLSTRK